MTSNSDFDRMAASRTTEGQRELAEAMRVLIARELPEVGEAIRAAPDSAFLEPLLFTYFREKEPALGLPQLLFGNLPPELRPDALECRSDRHGRVYLPQVGYFFTAKPDASLLLEWDRASDRYRLSLAGELVPHRFEAVLFLPGTQIEVLRYENPLVMTRFVNMRGEPAVPEIDGQADPHVDHLSRALSLLSAICPRYHEAMTAVTRQVVVFKHPDVNSFASINAHGTAFFNVGNVRSEHDEIFFFDELIHQCGHIVFNAMTLRRMDFFAKSPDGSLREYAPSEHDRRTLYDAFHGLYTEHMMTSWMRRLDEARVLQDRQADELFARFSFISRKFPIDVSNLSSSDIFTERGREMYEYFRQSCEENLRQRADVLTTNMSGQGYNFDFDEYVRRNPSRRSGAKAALASDPGRPSPVQ